MAFFTIGHSTHELVDFASMLTSNGVTHLIDVRSYPGSRRCPQFNKETLPMALQGFGIDYIHLVELGGRRRKSHDVDPARNGLWTHPAFHNYADYTLTSEFADGLVRLKQLGHAHNIAYMCSEHVWWKCHRRIITDYLLAADERVQHIMGVDKLTLATPTKGSTCVHGVPSYAAAQLDFAI